VAHSRGRQQLQFDCTTKGILNYEDLTVTVTVEDRVGTITINRRDKLNVIRQRTFAEFAAAVDQLTADDEVRVILLTATGAKSFSTGIDLDADGLPGDSQGWDEHTGGNADVIRKLW
jgi:enoyl-CoA hydratase/carnithine racemase